MITKAQARATKKYQEKAYDKILLRLPKGTKERIQNVSDSVNGYITQSVLLSLSIDESKKKVDLLSDDDVFLPFS